jgi:hypothetical protein
MEIDVPILERVVTEMNLRAFLRNQVTDQSELRRIEHKDRQLIDVEWRDIDYNRGNFLLGDDCELHALTLQRIHTHGFAWDGYEVWQVEPHAVDELFTILAADDHPFDMLLGVRGEYVKSYTKIYTNVDSRKPILRVKLEGEPGGIVRAIYEHIRQHVPDLSKL